MRAYRLFSCRVFCVFPACLACGLILLNPQFILADKGKIKVETIQYKGWKNNLKISNGDAELIVTLDVGPRIISYRLANGKNVMKEFEAQLGKSGEKDWQIRGGHRLWVAPEDLTRTYALDNGAVKYTVRNKSGRLKGPKGTRVRLTQAPDSKYGVQKVIDIYLAPKGSKVTLIHRVINIGKKPTQLAPWALTVLRGGGVEIIPLPPKKPHPGPTKNAKSPKDYAPNQKMVIWPYFDFADQRWTFGQKFITLRQDAKKGPTKIGLAHSLGWLAYLNEGTLFTKRISYQDGSKYPDGGCNFETFSNEDMLEMESLGPLVTLAPGKSAELKEEWSLAAGVPDFKTEVDIEKNIVPK